MTLLDSFTIVFAKFVSFLIQTFHLGAGATWSGEIALRLRPNILRTFAEQHKTIILVAGTNGKTTTVKMIETIFRKNGKKVVRNSSGANLDNGLVSTFIAHTGWNGKLNAQYFIFEVDEATVPIILRSVSPQTIVLINLFRDQLDRYGEVDAVAEKWLKVLCDLPATTNVFINGDDPQLAFLGGHLKANVKYFGLEDPDLFLPKMQHATDSIYCPKCGNRLTFGGVYFSHLGKFACGQCGFTHPAMSITGNDVESPLEGVYNVYNVMAATLVARSIGIGDKEIAAALSAFTPAFGRMEQITYEGKNVLILLSKNPTGFNESVRTVLTSKKRGPLLLLLNDRIPDGTDISWIWDVDFELLKDDEHLIKQLDTRMIFVSGDRCYDMGLRLKYAGVENGKMKISEDLEEAVTAAVSATGEKETLWVLATYSAMLDVRKILVGRKIL